MYPQSGKRPFSDRGLRVLAAVFLCLIGGMLAADERPPAVLIIYSYGDSLPWERGVIEGIRDAVADLPNGDKPTIFEETLDTSRLGKAAGKEAWGLYLSEKYASAGIDVVMTESQQAAELLFSLPDLFPDARRYVFHYAPLDRHPRAKAGERRFSSAMDLGRAVATITEILPDTERIVAVLDESAVGRARALQLRALAEQLPAETTLELWNSFLEEDLYDRAKALRPGAAIFYLPVQRDRTGAPLVPADVARKLAAVSPVPVFTHFDTLLGTGVVGGYLVSAHQLGRLMGKTAAYGDRGAPETQEEYATSCMGYYFDARALRRWKIADSRLPIGSRILFEGRSFVKEYGPYLALIIALFVLETALVFALIRSGVRRKRAMRLLDEERANLEAKIRQRTSDLEMMFKEFQHRVKNGLGIITSLVSLEAGRTEDERLGLVLSKLESRVVALATLYDMLYQTGGVMEVAADVYLGTLLENLGMSLGADSRGIKLVTRMESVPIDIKRAIPLALIANELVTNAFKYAFPGGRAGSIKITLAAEGADLRFTVADDGVGLGADFDPESGSGLGMTLVLLLSRQLEGTLTWTSRTGASFTLVFPK